MAMLRVMTCNVENLMRRFDFGRGEQQYLSIYDAWDDPDREILAKSFYNVLHDEIRTFTSLTIGAADPHVICLQEVDSLPALKHFHDRYLSRVGDRQRYRYKALIDANDPRGIDVAILSRYKIERIVTHQEHLDSSGKTVFSRDCLEVDVKAHGKTLTLFINHLKSMMGGRDQTRNRRVEQCKAIRDIVTERFQGKPEDHDWLIVGDLNDYYHVDGVADPKHSLGYLGIGTFSIDRTANLNAAERWTHYWAGGDEYRQLDYLLASPALASKNAGVKPMIVRAGLPHRAARYEGSRWPRVGYDRPKATDHCAVMAELSF